MKKRIDYLDILKAVAIFLVVFCHFVLLSPTVFANLFMCACWMAVPVFFMVNGALLFLKPLDFQKHLQKTLWVYGVMTVWKLVYLLSVPLLTGTGLEGVTVGSAVNYLFLFGELPGIVNGHLWFIEALLAVYLVFPLFRVLDDGSVQARRILWFFALACLFCTNGLYSLGVLGSMLRSAGLPASLSFDALLGFQPFGKYGNMLGFFLLGHLLARRKRPFWGKLWAQRLTGALLLFAGLLLLWGVKCYLSGQAVWDGILLQEGYRHVPVVFMAAGLFLLIKRVKMRNRAVAAFVRMLAARTLGIFYIHWIFGWMLVNPLAGWLMSKGMAFGVWTNILKNVVLMAPALAVTMVLERIPVVKRLVTG